MKKMILNQALLASLITLPFITLSGSNAWGEDFPGGDESRQELDKAFGDKGGVQSEDHQFLDKDRLKIGGTLLAEWWAYRLPQSTPDQYLTNPMTLEMYMDSQLRNDIRFFFRGRMVNDPTVDESKVSPLTGAAQRATTSSLDELKFNFHTQRKIFWTIGRQKIKWGAGQFWNPTDFINQERRNFLRQEDLRQGVSMVKAHVPWGNANFYALAVNEKAQESAQNGIGGRFEIPFSRGEWTGSIYSRRGQETLLGSDLSLAVWDFDVYAEAAQTDKGNARATTLGLTYAVKYSDEDTVNFSFEHFRQEDGIDDISQYTSLLLAGKWNPFFIAKAYSAFFVYLPSPGNWNDTSFSLSVIRNCNDKSSYTRLNWSYTGQRDIAWTVALGSHQGDPGTETRLGNLSEDLWVMAKLGF